MHFSASPPLPLASLAAHIGGLLFFFSVLFSLHWRFGSIPRSEGGGRCVPAWQSMQCLCNTWSPSDKSRPPPTFSPAQHFRFFAGARPTFLSPPPSRVVRGGRWGGGVLKDTLARSKGCCSSFSEATIKHRPFRTLWQLSSFAVVSISLPLFLKEKAGGRASACSAAVPFPAKGGGGLSLPSAPSPPSHLWAPPKSRGATAVLTPAAGDGGGTAILTATVCVPRLFLSPEGGTRIWGSVWGRVGNTSALFHVSG
ncbi:unnamed protein product [Ixodes pacificus]